MRPAILALFLFASACDQTVTFTVTQSGETTVERGLELQCRLAALNIGRFSDISFEDTQEFENQGVTKEDVKSAHLIDLKMRVKDPAGQDLSYLSRVAFHVESPGQSKALVAEQDSFPDNVDTVTFRMTGTELAPYVTAESMSITSEVTANGCPDTDQTLEVTAVFEVEATVQGLQKAARMATP
ncbi:MAG: hypothetical protein AB2A00_02615 [Myxococcota bacterium]